jgi:hypothetical protein
MPNWSPNYRLQMPRTTYISYTYKIALPHFYIFHVSYTLLLSRSLDMQDPALVLSALATTMVELSKEAASLFSQSFTHVRPS